MVAWWETVSKLILVDKIQLLGLEDWGLLFSLSSGAVLSTRELPMIFALGVAHFTPTARR